MMEFDSSRREILKACPWCGCLDQEPWGEPVRGFDSVNCPDCGLIYVKNRLNALGLEEYYADYLSRVHQADEEARRKRDLMYELEMDMVAPVASVGRVLDVGCSGGFLLDVLKSRGYACTGVEFGREAARCAAEKHEVFQGEFPRLELDGEFDLIIFRGVLEHVPAPRDYLDKAVSLVAPGGCVYITSTPDADSFSCSLYKEQWNQHEPEAHIMHFRRKHFEEYFAAKGFVKVLDRSLYEETPYANVPQDILNVAQAIDKAGKGESLDRSPAFWGNMMSVAFRKGEDR